MKRKIAEKIIKRIKNDEETNVSNNSVIRARDILGAKYVYDKYMLDICFLKICKKGGVCKKTNQLYIQDREVKAFHGADIHDELVAALNKQICEELDEELKTDPKNREMFKIIADKMFENRDTK